MKIGSERFPVYRVIVLLAALASALFAYALLSRGPQPPPELAASDVVTRLAPRPLRPDIVLVTLDSTGVNHYGPVARWPRAFLAQGLSRVETLGAKVVVFDLALDTRKTGDALLWRAMANHRNVVLGMGYEPSRIAKATADDTRGLVFLERDALADHLVLGPQTQSFGWQLFDPPVSDFTGSARGVGVFVRETDPDGVLRNARLVYTSKVDYTGLPPLSGKGPQSRLADGEPVALPNLALVASLRVLGLDKGSVQVATGDHVRLAGNLTPPVNVPVDAQGQMRIRFAGMAPRYPAYSFTDIASGKAKPNLSGKVVIFGATAPGDPATQMCPTPYGRMPRLFVTASALATLLDRSYVDVVGVHLPQLLGVLLVAGVVVGLCLMWVSGGRLVALAVVLTVAYLALAWALYAFGSVLLPLLPVLFVILVTTLIALALGFGPFRPRDIGVSPTYVPPPPDAMRD